MQDDAVTPEPVPPEPATPGVVPPHVFTAMLKKKDIKFQFRCKICIYLKTNPAIYDMIHNAVLRDHFSYSATIAYINKYLADNDIDLPPLNLVNFSTHFKMHVSPETAGIIAAKGCDIVTTAIQKANPGNKTLASVAQSIQDSGSEQDDFKNMDDVRKKITQVMEVLHSQLEEVDVDGQLKLNRVSVELFIRLISEVRACIAELSKMRQSEKLMRMVVQTIIDKVQLSIAPQLIDEFAVIAEELKEIGLDSETITKIDNRLRSRTAHIIATTSRSAVHDVQRKFKLA
jgi:hypothetical protein